MRLSSRVAAFCTSLLVVSGCSVLTSFSGLAGDEPTGEGGVANDASAIDGRVGDGSPSKDADHVVPPSDGTPTCNAATTITNALDTNLSSLTAVSTVSGYPDIESFGGGNVAMLFPFRDVSYYTPEAGPDADPDAEAAAPVQVQSELKDGRSGLWIDMPVPLVAFDVTFDAYLKCTAGSGDCADGLVLAWLDTTDPSVLKTQNYGGSGGIPDKVAGGGFVIDDYKNDTDPAVPALEIISFDGTKIADPDTTHWVVASESSSFLAAWHTYHVRLRGTAVTATIDGQNALSGTIGAPIATGLLGLTAGTGGESDQVAVRNFKATFYDCIPQ